MAVDDEKLLLEHLVEAVREAEPEAEVYGFTKSGEALAFAEDHTVDVAFLDINMRGMDGVVLAKHLKGLNPKVNIVFCTGYSDYYADAFRIRASGYLLKPIRASAVREELDNLRSPLETKDVRAEGIFIKCFGRFEVFFRGDPVQFKNGKTKELLAYLVDQEGALVKNQTILWDDNVSHISYVKKLKKDLTDTLRFYGIGNMIRRNLGTGEIGIVKERVNCDFYDWLENKPDAVNAFYGEYMEDYSWAEITKANLINLSRTR